MIEVCCAWTQKTITDRHACRTVATRLQLISYAEVTCDTRDVPRLQANVLMLITSETFLAVLFYQLGVIIRIAEASATIYCAI